jgi:hypothetical protein
VPKTTDVTPWVVVGDEPTAGFFDEPSGFLLPGQLVRWQREEAALRAEEQRKESERQERADARQELAMWSARQHAIARGLEWNPAKPFEHMPAVYARADMMFAAQDAEARATDFRAAKEAGLVHLLHQGVESQSPGPGDAGPPTSRALASGVAARANPVRSRIREAFTRWAHRATGPSCGCASCTGEDVHHTDEITRSFYEGARIR